MKKHIIFLTICCLFGCNNGNSGDSIPTNTSGNTLGLFRTIDGTDNNESAPTIGAVGTQLLRISPPNYADGISAADTTQLPNARDISNLVFSQGASKQSNKQLSHFIWAWGQFLDHDISLTPEQDSPHEPMPISIPAGDLQFDPQGSGEVTLAFGRSVFDTSTGNSIENPREQINLITAWIDGSQVYGSDDLRASWLRTGEGGLLKTTREQFLPFNDGSQDNVGGSRTDLFVAGDVRANEHVILSSLHTLFMREHNRKAQELSIQHPDWDDELLYQEARRHTSALLQSITYNEWLPALVGNDALPDYLQYDPTINASINNEFSTALFRMGHSMIPDTIERLDENREVIPEGNLNTREAFFRPDRILREGGIEPIIRGLCASSMQEVDTKIMDDVRSFLFGAPGAGGFDLAALNIQRGRDHGLADYNTIRMSYGLTRKASFDEISSNPAIAATLEQLYGDVDLVEAWVGALAEDHFQNASVGELIHTALLEQFTRLRDGDRFFYLNDDNFTPEQREIIHHTTLKDIILRNTTIEEMPNNVFFAS